MSNWRIYSVGQIPNILQPFVRIGQFGTCCRHFLRMRHGFKMADFFPGKCFLYRAEFALPRKCWQLMILYCVQYSIFRDVFDWFQEEYVATVRVYLYATLVLHYIWTLFFGFRCSAYISFMCLMNFDFIIKCACFHLYRIILGPVFFFL
jgi:hypothetical protein